MAKKEYDPFRPRPESDTWAYFLDQAEFTYDEDSPAIKALKEKIEAHGPSARVTMDRYEVFLILAEIDLGIDRKLP